MRHKTAEVVGGQSESRSSTRLTKEHSYLGAVSTSSRAGQPGKRIKSTTTHYTPSTPDTGPDKELSGVWSSLRQELTETLGDIIRPDREDSARSGNSVPAPFQSSLKLGSPRSCYRN